jgi:TPR repeat protein
MGNLVYLFRQGIGTTAEPFQASSWARAAAEKNPNSPRVLNELGIIYEEGRAVTQDKTEAARWYGLGANRGYQLAKDNAARLKANSPGAPSFLDGFEY